MSDLYNYNINKIDNDVLHVTVQIIQDRNEIPTTPNFSLQIILDPYKCLMNGWTLDMPFKGEEATRIFESAPCKEDMMEWIEMQDGGAEEFCAIADDQIISVARINEENYPPKPDPISWAEKSKMTRKERYELELNNPPLVTKADLIIKVKNQDLFFHLREGMNWSSASYDLSM